MLISSFADIDPLNHPQKHSYICFASLLFFIYILFTSINNSLIGNLQNETELGIHGVGLLGVDSKEGGIKVTNILQFTVPLWKTIKTLRKKKTALGGRQNWVNPVSPRWKKQ